MEIGTSWVMAALGSAIGECICWEIVACSTLGRPRSSFENLRYQRRLVQFLALSDFESLQTMKVPIQLPALIVRRQVGNVQANLACIRVADHLSVGLPPIQIQERFGDSRRI